MHPITLREITDAVAGRWVTPTLVPPAARIRAICTDTRHMEPESLFIAIKGDNHDAHRLLAKAKDGGAIAALVQQDVTPLPGLQLIHVPDTRKAMGALARQVRRRMTAQVVGVAGSNGKTSTKHLVDAALAGSLRGTTSPKSFNNDIGVPLTIFPADPHQDYLILEIGTNHPGEIRNLTHIAEPDAAVITNCGPEHLEFLGDLAGVRRENASIIERLNPAGLLVVNGDEPLVLDAVAAYPGRRVSFGFEPSNDLFASDVRADERGVRFRLNGQQGVSVPMLGRHTACNALAAIAVGRWFGLSDDAIFRGLSTALGPEMRLQLDKVGGVTLLNDAYNANPASMKAALETLCSLRAGGRRIAVVGDMRELGELAPKLHEEVGEFAASCELDGLMCVGEHADLIGGVAMRLGMAVDKVQRFPDAIAAARDIPGQLGDGDVVLLKASRGIHLELVADAIRKRAP